MVAFGSSPQLAAKNNLSDLSSGSSARANLAPIHQRPPTGNDVTGYTAGQSIWIGPRGEVYQLDSINKGKARWLPYTNPGTNPAVLVSGAVVAASTRRIVSAWTGSLFTVTRATDLATQTIGTLPDGSPDVSTLAAFLAPSLGIGYCTTIYDQSGAGSNLTQTVLAAAPMVDMTTIVGGNVPLNFNNTLRQYQAALTGFAVTWVSGTTVTATALPLPAYILPGMGVSASNVPGGTTLVSVNYTTGNMVLSAAPSAAPSPLVFASQMVYMDIPNTAQVPWRTWSVVMSTHHGAWTTNARKPFILGVHGLDAQNTAGNWAGMIMAGNAFTGFRPVNGNSMNNAIGFGPYAPNAPQVVALSMNGQAGSWQFGGSQGSSSGLIQALPPVATLSGGALGANGQYAGSAPPVGDFSFFDFILWPTTIALSDITRITTSINLARGWKPQIVQTITADGSSTTLGNGSSSQYAWPYYMSVNLADASPVMAQQAPTGGTIEAMTARVPTDGIGNAAAVFRNLLVVHPGLGNSLQASGNIAVTGTNTTTGVLTVSSTVNSAFAMTGYSVYGDANLPASTQIAYTGSTITVTPPPTGNVNTLYIANDTASVAWSSLTAYCQAAVNAGYKKIVLIGSAGRGGFSVPQLANFNTVKTFYRELWRTLPGVVGFVDLEDDIYFGDDGGTMTVTALSATTVTVNALSAYAVNTNRVRWAGMPYSVTNNTGGQTISGLSGLTFSVADTTGLSIGATIRAVNPTPWTTYPAYWQTDQQHFTILGYEIQGATFAQYILDNGVLA